METKLETLKEIEMATKNNIAEKSCPVHLNNKVMSKDNIHGHSMEGKIHAADIQM